MCTYLKWHDVEDAIVNMSRPYYLCLLFYDLVRPSSKEYTGAYGINISKKNFLLLTVNAELLAIEITQWVILPMVFIKPNLNLKEKCNKVSFVQEKNGRYEDCSLRVHGSVIIIRMNMATATKNHVLACNIFHLGIENLAR